MPFGDILRNLRRKQNRSGVVAATPSPPSMIKSFLVLFFKKELLPSLGGGGWESNPPPAIDEPLILKIRRATRPQSPPPFMLANSLADGKHAAVRRSAREPNGVEVFQQWNAIFARNAKRGAGLADEHSRGLGHQGRQSAFGRFDRFDVEQPFAL